jgi:hypothetical protein
MSRFTQVKEILDAAVGGPTASVGGPHGPFWRTLTRDQFVAFEVFGIPLVSLGDGGGSTIVKALRGEDPFGQDTGNPSGQFRRMPAGRPPVAAEQIAVIAAWIDDGCPEEDEEPLGPLEVGLNGVGSGESFVIVSTSAQPLPATLTLRTADGSQGEVVCRASQASVAQLTLSPSTVHVSGAPTEVQVLATTPSSGRNDTTVEVVRGTEVLAQLDLTVVSAPVVRFAGRFMCRLATDPDPFDHPWGERSSFGVYAVQGPDPANPDEPPLDRVIRFHGEVARRPLCAPVGVSVVAIEAEVAGSTVRFEVGDPLIGEPVRVGSDCKFDGRNRTFAPDGFEPISDFWLEVGSVFAGASAPAVPRSSPDEPPGSTAPYANGIFVLDADSTLWSPSDFGYPEATWAEHAWAVVARKLARLVVQQPTDDRSARIRERRLREHAVERLPAIGTPMRLMERYSGLIDRELHIAPDPVGALAYLSSLPAIQFEADFLDFDTDCQTGTVTGMLRAPAPLEAAPSEVRVKSALRRTAPLDE